MKLNGMYYFECLRRFVCLRLSTCWVHAHIGLAPILPLIVFIEGLVGLPLLGCHHDLLYTILWLMALQVSLLEPLLLRTQ